MNQNCETKRAIIHIDKDTLIPLSLVMAVISGIATGAIWATNLSSKVNYQDQRITKLEANYETTTNGINSINTALATLIESVNNINKRLDTFEGVK